MSAPNFSCSHNSRHLCAFLLEGYDEYKSDFIANNYDDDEEVPGNIDNWLYQDWYDMEKEYHLEDLERQLKEKFGRDFIMEDYNPCDGQTVATILHSFIFAGHTFCINFTIDFEAGYYEGFKLDWNLAKCGYMEYLPNLDDCRDMLYYNADCNEGLSSMLASKLEKRFEQEVTNVGDAISDVLEICSPFVLEGACMSNGEGMYWRVEKTA